MIQRQLAVVIGRFAPVHNAHIENLITKALTEADSTLILFGSSLAARNPKNPFTWEERQLMLLAAIDDYYAWPHPTGISLIGKLHFAALKDYAYSNNRWILQVQKQVAKLLAKIAQPNEQWNVVLYGNNKDDSSFYLKLFPQWSSCISDFSTDDEAMSATDIRKAIYAGDWDQIATTCSPSVVAYLRKWAQTEEGRWVTEEAIWNDNYQMVLARKRDEETITKLIEKKALELDISFAKATQLFDYVGYPDYVPMPYKPVYHTCDNVVLWRGHVLLIRRRPRPGKGLWALPGGFLNPDEWIAEGALREGEEESKVRIYPPGTDLKPDFNSMTTPEMAAYRKPKPMRLSRAWQTARRCFDNPDRSLRGRLITDAFLWQIPDEFEVEVTAGDDAESGSATFWSLHDILNGPMDLKLFEDHQAIIAHMVL